MRRVLAMLGWDKSMLKRKMPFTARQVSLCSPPSPSHSRTSSYGGDGELQERADGWCSVASAIWVLARAAGPRRVRAGCIACAWSSRGAALAKWSANIHVVRQLRTALSAVTSITDAPPGALCLSPRRLCLPLSVLRSRHSCPSCDTAHACVVRLCARALTAAPGSTEEKLEARLAAVETPEDDVSRLDQSILWLFRGAPLTMEEIERDTE